MNATSRTCSMRAPTARTIADGPSPSASSASTRAAPRDRRFRLVEGLERLHQRRPELVQRVSYRVHVLQASCAQQ